MSFKHNGVLVTLGNYIEIFKDYEPDILDEIRSAILDDTPISSFIKYCGNDAYKLGQLRMAVREYVPKEFINPRLSGRCVYYIRQMHRNGLSLDSLEFYIPKKGKPTIEDSNLETIIKAVYCGADIRKVDFNIVPTENIEVICEGLVKGYPMWLCTGTDSKITNNVIKQLMKGMQLQVDIHPFLDGTWSEEQIILVLSNATRIDVNKLLEHISSKFSVSQISEITRAARRKLDFTLLCMKEEDGSPSFNEFQMDVLTRCLDDDVLTQEIYNPMLSDMEMSDLYLAEKSKAEKEHKKKLSGTLK